MFYVNLKYILSSFLFHSNFRFSSLFIVFVYIWPLIIKRFSNLGSQFCKLHHPTPPFNFFFFEIQQMSKNISHVILYCVYLLSSFYFFFFLKFLISYILNFCVILGHGVKLLCMYVLDYVEIFAILF